MPQPKTPLADALASLEADLTAAQERYSAAKDRRRHEAGLAPKAATAALVEFRDAIAFKKPDAPSEDERLERQRELTRQLLEEVEQRGLVFEPIGRGGAVTLIDIADREYVKEADRGVVAAQKAVNDFKAENRDALATERKAAEADRIREALQGDDPDAIREAINGSQKAAALTTADLDKPAPRTRVTSPA